MFLWVEKFRPSKVADCILPERITKFVQDMINKGEIQNLMLTGSAGTGKTTLARALCEELDMDCLLINCSENGNIDTLRTTIRGFASTVSLMGGLKCVILDEADGLTNVTQQALRAFIEEFSDNCRFIFTANYANKLIEPLMSRTIQIDMSLKTDEKVQVIRKFDARVKAILEMENVTYDKTVLAQLIMKYFPDFRKTLNELQKLTMSGTLDASSMASVSGSIAKEIYAMLKNKKFSEMRKWVGENPDNDFQILSRLLWNKVDEFVSPDSIPQMLLHVNTYQINDTNVIDKEINLMAFLTELMVDLQYK